MNLRVGTPSSADSVTLIRARGALRLAKRWTRDKRDHAVLRCRNYDDCRHFDLETRRLSGLRDLGLLLRELQQDTRTALVRGAPIPGTSRTSTRRLTRTPRAGDDDPTLFDVPRWWMALDLDSVPDPEGTNFVTGTQECLAAVVEAVLPAELHNVQCVWQATASAGFKEGIRARLWYWLDRPVQGDVLKLWMPRPDKKAFIGYPVDHALFSAATPHYTAAPILCDGIPDPMAKRFGVLKGEQRCAHVPVGLEEQVAKKRERIATSTVTANEGDRRYALGALRGEVGEVEGAEPGDRHGAVNRAAFKLARFIASGSLTEDEVEEALIAAAWAAGLTDGEGELQRIMGYGFRDGGGP